MPRDTQGPQARRLPSRRSPLLGPGLETAGTAAQRSHYQTPSRTLGRLRELPERAAQRLVPVGVEGSPPTAPAAARRVISGEASRRASNVPSNKRSSAGWRWIAGQGIQTPGLRWWALVGAGVARFPSWTSPVRVRSPALWKWSGFQKLEGAGRPVAPSVFSLGATLTASAAAANGVGLPLAAGRTRTNAV
jgi:hypothetical protein